MDFIHTLVHLKIDMDLTLDCFKLFKELSLRSLTIKIV